MRQVDELLKQLKDKDILIEQLEKDKVELREQASIDAFITGIDVNSLDTHQEDDETSFYRNESQMKQTSKDKIAINDSSL